MAASNAISWPSQCICSPSGVNVLDPIFASVVSLGCALIFAVAFCRTGLVVYVVDVGWWTSGAAVVCKRIRSHSCGCECEGRERLLGWKWSESNGSDELKLLVWAQHLLQAGTFLRLRSGPTKEHRQTSSLRGLLALTIGLHYLTLVSSLSHACLVPTVTPSPSPRPPLPLGRTGLYHTQSTSRQPAPGTTVASARNGRRSAILLWTFTRGAGMPACLPACAPNCASPLTHGLLETKMQLPSPLQHA